MRLIIPGTPIAKKRPRFVKKTGHAYNDQQTEEGKFLVQAIEQATKKFGKDEPILASFLFVFGRPKSHYGTGKNAGVLKRNAPVWHVKKPDCTNLVKFPEDVFNSIMWYDDSQIIGFGRVLKRYIDNIDEEPRTEILVEPASSFSWSNDELQSMFRTLIFKV